MSSGPRLTHPRDSCFPTEARSVGQQEEGGGGRLGPEDIALLHGVLAEGVGNVGVLPRRKPKGRKVSLTVERERK